MNSENVCKFNFNRSSDIICLNFIKESNESQSHVSVSGSYSINIVINGSGCLCVNNSCCEIEKGDVFFVCEGDRFSISSRDSLEYCYICFKGRRAEEYIQRLGVHTGNRIFSAYNVLIPFWLECHELAEDSNIDVLCEAVLLYSIARLKPEKKEASGVLSKIISLTQENFTDSQLSISAIASELGYDSKYLSSLFKKKMGIPFTQYLREQRIKHAIFLMEQGVVSVKNTALLSGFNDALYFSKVFTASEGISPKAYIAKLQSDNLENIQ